MILHVFSMCAILLATSGYDCEEKWVVYIYDDFDVYKYCYPGQKEFHHVVVGCGTYNDIRGHTIILGRNGTADSHTGDNVFIHEIKHLACLCNYHASPPEDPRR